MIRPKPKLIPKIQLYDSKGARLFLNNEERQAFLKETERHPKIVRSLCMTLCLTGCRVSEALNLIVASIDFKDKTIIFDTFRQSQRTVFRTLPVPDNVLDNLDLAHNLRQSQRTVERIKNPLWDMRRQTAYNRIAGVMRGAGIRGKYATPKGLRHSFGVHAVNCGVPLNILQQWLGHESISTTAIYGTALKDDVRIIAKRMW